MHKSCPNCGNTCDTTQVGNSLTWYCQVCHAQGTEWVPQEDKKNEPAKP